MPTGNPQLVCRLGALVLLALGARLCTGEPTIVEGTVTGEVAWQGEVHLIGPVTLSQAKVIARPGCKIRLLPKGGLGGQLILGTTYEDEVRLALAGTEEAPIELVSPAEAPAGCIEMRVSRKARLEGRHVSFQGLRASRPASAEPTTLPGEVKRPAARPGLRVHLEDAESQFTLERCAFTGCGPLHVAFLGADAEFQIDHCQFADELEPYALQLTGPGGGQKPVRGNRFTAGVSISAGGVVFEGNVLIGPQAAVRVWGQLDGVLIRANYVHNTADVADGRYCLTVRSPKTLVTDNVLRGGTYTIEQAPGRLEGNVLIAAEGLEPPRLAGFTRKGRVPTHGLVNALPADALVARNIFVGPAWSMLRTDERSEGVTIAHNTFDGVGGARRALHFNRLGARADCQADIRNNCFLRLSGPPIYDEAHHSPTIARCDWNAYVPRPDSRFENVVLPDSHGGERWLFHDLLAGSVDQIGLTNLPDSIELLPVEAQLATGQGTPAEVLSAWRQRYGPQPGSALIDAGATIDALSPPADGKPDIGAVEAANP